MFSPLFQCFYLFRFADFEEQDLASKGITAEKWSATVAEVIGGKAGGKEPTRQGSGTQPEKIDEAVAKAEKWLTAELEKLEI